MSELAGPVKPDEVDALIETDQLGFSWPMSATRRERFRQIIDTERSIASRDNGQVVGAADSVLAEMTLPGPLVLPVTAVVGVAVRPTHRRQGRLAAMMRYQLDSLHESGEQIAVLTASESRIYQRFGYGPATLASAYVLESKDLSVLDPAGLRSGCSLRFVDLAEAETVFPSVLRAAQAKRAGEVSRLDLGWDELFGRLDAPEPEDRFFVVCSDASGPVGYVVYRVVASSADGGRRRVVRLAEFVSTTDAAYVSLWSFLVDIDLVHEIRTRVRPVDEPIRFVLSDLRRMDPIWTSEHTFVRLVDVDWALSARRYFDAGELTMSVEDPFCPWNTGLYRIRTAGDGSAAVERGAEVSAAADLACDASALGSLYLGGLRAGALATIGLIREQRPGALAAADRMFVGSGPPPFCSTEF